ncbi:MAG: sulfotransferase, partial [Acidimicrobiales bacterium]
MSEPVRERQRLRVIYIAGAKNCGSTLLDAVLGGAAGVRSLGEVAGFHRLQPDSECACRMPPEGCGPCQAVLSSLASAPGLPVYQRLSRLPLKERRLHWTLIGTRRRAGYARCADGMFEAVAGATGCRVLVDSSKNASRAAALVHDSRHDVRVVHLVRDGRGYVQSRRRRAGGGAGRLTALGSLVAWLAKNVLIGSLLARRLPPGRYLLVTYEDLMLDPAATLERIGRFADLDTSR